MTDTAKTQERAIGEKWYAEFEEVFDKWCVVERVGGPDGPVAKIIADNLTEKEAREIAAGPEVRAAAMWFLNALDRLDENGDDETIDENLDDAEMALRAAIKKGTVQG